MTNAVNDFRLLHGGGGGLCRGGGAGCPETQTQHDDRYVLHVWTTNAVNPPSAEHLFFSPTEFCSLYLSLFSAFIYSAITCSAD